MAKLTSEQVDNITLKLRAVNRGGVTVDKVIKNLDGTSVISFTSNCRSKHKGYLDWDGLQAQLKQEPLKNTHFEQLKKRPVTDSASSYYVSPEFVPHVAQHDIDTCCGTTANNVQNLYYVKQLEAKVRVLEDLMGIYHCDTILQFHRYVSGLTKRCDVLTQQVNQLKIREQELLDHYSNN